MTINYCMECHAHIAGPGGLCGVCAPRPRTTSSNTTEVRE